MAPVLTLRKYCIAALRLGAPLHSTLLVRGVVRSSLSLFLFPCLLLTASPVLSQGSPAQRETYVKSTYLMNFARYVYWPEGTFEGEDSPLMICTLGRSGMWPGLRDVVRGQKSGGRSVRARQVFSADEASSCQVLFVGEEIRHFSAEDFEQLGEYPILTVGEAEEFLAMGGAIRLARTDNRITFDINLDASDRAGLTLSSRMLDVAREVIGRENGTGTKGPPDEKEDRAEDP